jgi:hypothetical protein
MPKVGDFVVAIQADTGKEFWGTVDNVWESYHKANRIMILTSFRRPWHGFAGYTKPNDWRRIPKYAIAGFIAMRTRGF